MKLSDAYRYAYLQPTASALIHAYTQVKTGPGQLRSVWVMDDLSPVGQYFYVWDGILGQPTSPGLPPSLSGRLMFDQAVNQLGPMCANFFQGLVIEYQANILQLSGFVSYR